MPLSRSQGVCFRRHYRTLFATTAECQLSLSAISTRRITLIASSRPGAPIWFAWRVRTLPIPIGRFMRQLSLGTKVPVPAEQHQYFLGFRQAYTLAEREREAIL